MWSKLLPWKRLISRYARSHGFLDPLDVFSAFLRFAQPSEVTGPIELIRASVIFHARGLMNSRAIQHNLDWVWPYWVTRQFDPGDDSFLPRALSLTHINLSHRNWTAVGIPDFPEYAIVDPRGLVTPLFDGWSLDFWIIGDDGNRLFPSRLLEASQEMGSEPSLAVLTRASCSGLHLETRTVAEIVDREPVCAIQVTGRADTKGWLVVSLRPCNPEGVSFVHHVELDENGSGWKVEKKHPVRFSETPDRSLFSEYQAGDVALFLPNAPEEERMHCRVGLATAAALFRLEPGKEKRIEVLTPLEKKHREERNGLFKAEFTAPEIWNARIAEACPIRVPDGHFEFLYRTAVRNLILHSPGEVYPGPYTYKHFWFRDAVFILHALLCSGISGIVERILHSFPGRQNHAGFFKSQDGEWDSNGQALWIMRRFCELTGKPVPSEWLPSVEKGGKWIAHKRLSKVRKEPHAGLFPPGFSAEHLGPNDYYYWDDFWGVEGLRSAAWMLERSGRSEASRKMNEEANRFLEDIEISLRWNSENRLKRAAMAASPYRRLDAGAIGSLVVGYPLQLWEPDDERLLDTVAYLLEHCMFEDGFFQDMMHSGINPYLTLHIAQVLLRGGNPMFLALWRHVAKIASPTGQWPEAVHPRTGGGCMGDGQHIWAAAEWVLMMRNAFVYEEQRKARLILCAGIPREWLQNEAELLFGPAPTSWGPIRLALRVNRNRVLLEWHLEPRGPSPDLEVRLGGGNGIRLETLQGSLWIG